MANNEFKDLMPGGLADAFTPSDFDPKQLKIGIDVELEHTSDPIVAREIAMDHLTEDPLYYQKLKTIEESIKEYTKAFLNEMIYVTRGIPQEMIEDFEERGVNIYKYGSKHGFWDPKKHGLTKLQVEIILAALEEKIDQEKDKTPEESATNFKDEDLAIANIMGGRKNPNLIQKAKIYNMSHLMDDLKALVVESSFISPMSETWDQYLEKVIDTGDEFPWDNEEEPEFNKNPMNPFDANNSLSKVKANAHPKTQRAGVGKGSGPAGGGRFPGGKRQATSSVH